MLYGLIINNMTTKDDDQDNNDVTNELSENEEMEDKQKNKITLKKQCKAWLER